MGGYLGAEQRSEWTGPLPEGFLCWSPRTGLGAVWGSGWRVSFFLKEERKVIHQRESAE